MSKRTSTIIVVLMIIAGLSLILYPTVSDYLKTLAYRRTISGYTATVAEMDDSAYEQMLSDARDYNRRLAESGGGVFILDDRQLEEYNSLLNVDGTGIMGYVSIPKVDIALPIYHGTDEGSLQSGVGHLEGSSLPVGGDSTHAVLSAHTGLPSAKLFTNIDQLVVGDTFTVRVLREVLTYEVDQILVVLPTETSALRIETGADYCTLLTCTPYGVNTHRLLVRGHRIPTPPEEEDLEPVLSDPERTIVDLWPVAVALLALLLLAILVVVLRRRRRSQGGTPSKNKGGKRLAR